MAEHKIGTREEWQAARDELLAMEKELTQRKVERGRRQHLPRSRTGSMAESWRSGAAKAVERQRAALVA